jgi:hypothetical protein
MSRELSFEEFKADLDHYLDRGYTLEDYIRRMRRYPWLYTLTLGMEFKLRVYEAARQPKKLD